VKRGGGEGLQTRGIVSGNVVGPWDVCGGVMVSVEALVVALDVSCRS
jgi:hypothetical protein